MADPIALMVNGESRLCSAGLTLEPLLQELGYQPRLVVVEFNGSILPRAQWPQQAVVEGDQLEVVTIVGGG
ncbi:MAG: sulfur carrier protein ThiS [Synechococcus sp.]|nr:sulfur carrier protein ThiS [Synechococcus sp.]